MCDVSMLHKYLDDSSHVVDYKFLQIDDSLRYEKKPIRILSREVKVFCTRNMVKKKKKKKKNKKKEYEVVSHCSCLKVGELGEGPLLPFIPLERFEVSRRIYFLTASS